MSVGDFMLQKFRAEHAEWCKCERCELFDELRARRAADLSAEDVEALRFFRDFFADEAYMGAGYRADYPDQAALYDRALAALDKLLGGRDA